MKVSKKAANATSRRVHISGCELKAIFKQVSTQIVKESQAAILRLRAELQHKDSEALRQVATRRAVLRNLVEEFRCSFSETTDVVPLFNEDMAIVELVQTKEAELNQTTKGGTETDVTRDQQ